MYIVTNVFKIQAYCVSQTTSEPFKLNFSLRKSHTVAVKIHTLIETNLVQIRKKNFKSNIHVYTINYNIFKLCTNILGF